MTSRAEEAEAALIESVCSALPEHVVPDRVQQGELFIRRFYRWLAPEDLVGRGVHDLLEAALAMWDFAQLRSSGSACVRAYNPPPDSRAQRPHTLVEVITDDMPFLVDSVSMELARRGYRIRVAIIPVIDVVRASDGRLVEVRAPEVRGTGAVRESFMQFEIDREPDPERLDALAAGVRSVLDDVRAAVDDGPRMRRRMQELGAGLVSAAPALDAGELSEVAAFLEWAAAGNFIFLGYREYELASEDDVDVVRGVDGSGLGLLRRASIVRPRGPTALSPEVRALIRSPDPLILTKANRRSTVHRPLYLDYIGVKRFRGEEVCGEDRFLGLYTTAAELTSPRAIPILRGKVSRIMRRAGFPPGGHQERALTKTLHVYPRDELLQIGDEELFSIATAIVALDERQRVRLFARTDPFKRFVSCLVFLPRERYSTENCELIAAVLERAYGATEVEWAVQVSDSKLARIHYVARCQTPASWIDADALEREVARATRPWSRQLADALREVHGEERGEALFRRYESAFPTTYRADWRARAAVPDIDRAEALAAGESLVVNVYQSDDGDRTTLRCKLLSPGTRIALSDVLPIFENMGLRVNDERPYELTPAGLESIWLYDLGVEPEFEVELRTGPARAMFQDAFAGIWMGEFENDRLGRLVLAATLTAAEVSLLRAVLKYLRQAGSNFSDRYLQQALTGHAEIARLLVELFHARLHPERADLASAERLGDELERAIDEIPSRDQARILRQCLAVVRATVRTNYYREPADRACRSLLSLKLDPALIGFLAPPRPRFETFVCSPRVEGVYLRAGSVARGGIHWSDEREAFRAETLRLMEAETLRNAAIAAVGAKGCFVVKRPPAGGQKALLEEAGECYRLFVAGLLDVTDNVEGPDVVPAPGVVRHDRDDSYLLVGADQQTAPLAEVAMRLAAERGFWLAEAFAACGSDRSEPRHAAVGARGTWTSVTRHFRDIGRSVQSEDITVIGIGDMSAAAFGGGMLQSRRIRLIGAFDGDTVFLDPSPDPAAGFAERQRLSARRSSSWLDYDRDAISEGGGVFARSAQDIRLSPPARRALDVDAETVTGDGLVQALLRAPVDLLWSAGSGTYVKAQAESNAEVGDKANDAVRIDGAELRCAVVGEACGGGLTQLARIEYARSGGRINTDVIDTCAGLSYSDQEVNLRILLDAAGERERPALQAATQTTATHDALATLAVGESHAQALAVSLERRQATTLIDLHARLIVDLERRGVLVPGRARLPDETQVRELKAANRGLSGPEVATLLSAAKLAVADDLRASDVSEDAYFGSALVDGLPDAVAEPLRAHVRHHRLRREMVASDLANSIVDRQGTTFVSRLAEETGADTAHIARAYAAAAAVFDVERLWADLQALDGRADEDAQFAMLLGARRLVTRAARWLVTNRRRPLDIPAAVADYASGAAALWDALPELLSALDAPAWADRVQGLTRAGVPRALASRVSAMDAVFFVFDIVEGARGTDQPIRRAAQIHFGLERRLELSWLRDHVLALPRGDIWQTLARSNLRDRLYATHSALTATVLRVAPGTADPDAAIESWLDAVGARAERYLGTLRDVRGARGNEFTMLLVAVNELANLTQRARTKPLA